MKEKQLTILFIIIIGSLTFLNLISPSKGFSEKENRYLQQIPMLSWSNVLSGNFASSFEKYSGDQFILRDYWVGLKTLSEKSLVKKDNGRIYFGKDDYLFDVKAKFDSGQYNKNIAYLNQFVRNLHVIDKNIEITALLVPTKASTLKNLLPSYAPILDEAKLFADIKKDLSNNISLVSPQRTLSLNKNTYYKSDHHWTSFGAYLSYREYLEGKLEKPLALEEFCVEVVTKEFLGSSYRKANLFSYKGESISKYTLKKADKLSITYNENQKRDSLYEEGFLEKTDKYAYFMGGDHALVKIESEVLNNKSLLVVKDSFANSMLPFLVSHFNEIYVVDPRYYNGSIANLVEENNINEVLLLFNIQTFVLEKSLIKLNK